MGAAPAIRTPAQNRAIHQLLGQLRPHLGQEDADGLLRQLCREASGQEHSSALTVTQAARVIDGLRRRVPQAPPAQVQAPPKREPWGPRGEGPRNKASITPTQQRVLGAMFEQAGMTTPEQRQAFARRQCKRPWPQSQQDYDAIFGALTAMILRAGGRAPELLAMARAAATRPEIQGHHFWGVFVPDIIQQLEAQADKALSPHKLKKLMELQALTAPANSEEVAP